MAFAIEALAEDEQIQFVLGQPRQASSATSLTSDTSLTFGREMLHRFDVDWAAYGYSESDLDELAEFGIRTLHSFLMDPGQPPRRGKDLRRYLLRWIGPAIAHPRSATSLEALAAASRSTRRRTTAS